MDWLCENLDICNASERAEIAANNADKLSAKLLRSARLARITAEFATGRNRAQMIEAATNLERIGNGIGRLDNIHGNFEAIVGIYSVLDGINAGTIRDNPQRAARAFGQLFVHVGTLAQHLPPPLNQYARFLLGAGAFFENMRDMMDPESPNTVRGRNLREAVNTRPY